MFDGVVNSSDQLPGEFDEVTAEVKYPPITKETTEKEFVKKAGNGYMTWVAVAGGLTLIGLGLFLWGVYGIAVW